MDQENVALEGKKRRGLAKDQIHKVIRRRRTCLRSSAMDVTNLATMLAIAHKGRRMRRKGGSRWQLQQVVEWRMSLHS